MAFWSLTILHFFWKIEKPSFYTITNTVLSIFRRIFSTLAFKDSSSITFGDDSNSFFWIPWIMPHIGGPIGALVYQLMIEGHHPDEI